MFSTVFVSSLPSPRPHLEALNTTVGPQGRLPGVLRVKSHSRGGREGRPGVEKQLKIIVLLEGVTVGSVVPRSYCHYLLF